MFLDRNSEAKTYFESEQRSEDVPGKNCLRSEPSSFKMPKHVIMPRKSPNAACAMVGNTMFLSSCRMKVVVSV